MKKYMVKTIHDRKAVTAMSMANASLYHANDPLKIAGLGTVLIALGFILRGSIPPAVSTVLILIGCLVFSNADYSAKSDARKVLQQMGENFPTIQLSFSDNAIAIQTPEQSGTLDYHRIKRLGEDHAYFFLFLGDHHAYVLDKAGFITGSADTFPAFIEAKTDLTIEPALGFWHKILTCKLPWRLKR